RHAVQVRDGPGKVNVVEVGLARTFHGAEVDPRDGDRPEILEQVARDDLPLSRRLVGDADHGPLDSWADGPRIVTFPGLGYGVELQQNAGGLRALPREANVAKLAGLGILRNSVIPAGQVRAEALKGRNRKRALARVKRLLAACGNTAVLAAAIVKMGDEKVGAVFQQLDLALQRTLRELRLARIGHRDRHLPRLQIRGHLLVLWKQPRSNCRLLGGNVLGFTDILRQVVQLESLFGIDLVLLACAFRPGIELPLTGTQSAVQVRKQIILVRRL